MVPVLFFALWIVLNGRFTWEIAAFGVVLTAALSYFCVRFLDYKPRQEWKRLALLPDVLRYLGTLLKEIVRSNFALMRYVYGGAKPKPQLVTFHTPIHNPALQAVLADSITVTPGTITVFLENGDLAVHCLDEAFADGVEDLAFQRMLVQMEQKGEAKEP